MIITSTFHPSKNDVVTIRLVSGEEVIGRFVEQDATTLLLSKPVALTLHMLPNNNAQLGISPLMGSIDENSSVRFAVAGLTVLPSKPREDIANSYVQQTSDIQPVSSDFARQFLKG